MQKFLSADINEWINYLLIVLVFLIPITPLRDYIYGLIIFLWLIEGNFITKFKILKKNFHIILIIYLSLYLLRFLSNFWSDSLYEGSYRGGNSIIYCLTYDFFYLLIIPIILTSFKKEYFKYIISSFILSMFISEIISYGIIFGLWTTKHGSFSNPTPFLHNHSFYSLFLVITIFWLLKLVMEEDNKTKKIIYSIFILTATTNLFLNSARTGQVIFIILLFFSLIYFYQLKLKTIITFLIISILSFFIYYKISPNFKFRVNQTLYSIQKIEENKFNTSLGGRVLAYIVVKNIAIKHPFGVGVGSSRKYLDKEVEKYGKENMLFFKSQISHTHNQFLQNLLETGIIGLILYILFWILIFKNIKNTEHSYYFYIFFISYFLTLNIETLIRNKYSFLLFNIFLSIFIMELIKESKTPYKNY